MTRAVCPVPGLSPEDLVRLSSSLERAAFLQEIYSDFFKWLRFISEEIIKRTQISSVPSNLHRLVRISFFWKDLPHKSRTLI